MTHSFLSAIVRPPLVICAKLQELEKPIRAVFFVAPFLGKIGIPNYDKPNANFNSFPFNWKLISQKANRFYIYRSNNDPYVPERTGKILAEKLKVTETIIPEGDHLNAESGYVSLTYLLKGLEKELWD